MEDHWNDQWLRGTDVTGFINDQALQAVTNVLCEIGIHVPAKSVPSHKGTLVALHTVVSESIAARNPALYRVGTNQSTTVIMEQCWTRKTTHLSSLAFPGCTCLFGVMPSCFGVE